MKAVKWWPKQICCAPREGAGTGTAEPEPKKAKGKRDKMDGVVDRRTSERALLISRELLIDPWREHVRCANCVARTE
jgi:hypothetical protein